MLKSAVLLLPTFGLCLWPNQTLASAAGAILLVAIVVQIVKEEFSWSRPPFAYLSLFFATALIGFWAAYNSQNALTKLLVLAIAGLLAVYLAGGASENRRGAVSILGIGAVFFSLAFFAVQGLQIGHNDLLTPNRFGGLIAMLTPFLLLPYLQTKLIWLRIMVVSGAVIVGVALTVTQSRGAIASLLIGLFLWGLITGRAPVPFNPQLQKMLAPLLFSLLIALGFGGFYTVSQLQSSVLASIPGAGSRLTLYANLQYLLPDYWLLGGGLNAFSGHYSQYVLSVPFLRFTYGHHLYLDLILEQGIAGWVAFMLIVGAACVKIFTAERPTPLHGAVLASLATLLLHGFIDNALYSNAGSTMLFVPAALAFSLPSNKRFNQVLKMVNLTAIVLAVALIGLFNQKIISAWHSNIGAIKMAQVQLAVWPTGEWSRGEAADELATVAPRFTRSLEANEQNSTAFYRLGLIEMEQQNFEAAADYLAQAHAHHPDHIGIRKSLGYALLWSGQQDEAAVHLNTVEGIANELDAYIWWWQGLGRPELSEIAQNARKTYK